MLPKNETKRKNKQKRKVKQVNKQQQNKQKQQEHIAVPLYITNGICSEWSLGPTSLAPLSP